MKSSVPAILCVLLHGAFVLPIASQETKRDESAKKSVPRAGVNGVGFPVCIYCRAPDYTAKARADKLQGAVALDVTVTLEGKATEVVVIRGLGDGLDEKAIEAVKAWKFKPAKDRDGKPVTVCVPIEIAFRLLK